MFLASRSRPVCRWTASRHADSITVRESMITPSMSNRTASTGLVIVVSSTKLLHTGVVGGSRTGGGPIRLPLPVSAPWLRCLPRAEGNTFLPHQVAVVDQEQVHDSVVNRVQGVPG